MRQRLQALSHLHSSQGIRQIALSRFCTYMYSSRGGARARVCEHACVGLHVSARLLSTLVYRLSMPLHACSCTVALNLHLKDTGMFQGASEMATSPKRWRPRYRGGQPMQQISSVGGSRSMLVRSSCPHPWTCVSVHAAP